MNAINHSKEVLKINLVALKENQFDSNNFSNISIRTVDILMFHSMLSLISAFILFGCKSNWTFIFPFVKSFVNYTNIHMH